jgi:tRNA dimethylallyltransferase
LTNCFAIVGPTGIGKTSLSISLAKKIDGQIIGLDSRQIYKNIPIGTAQPSLDQLQEIKHYLVGVKELNESTSAGDFIDLVDRKIEKILSDNNVPIICGGTGLYLKALIEGIFLGSKTDSNIRSILEKKYDEGFSNQLFDELSIIDPEYSKKVHPNNRRRLIRAIEIYKITGKNMTENFKLDNKKSDFSNKIKTVYLKMSRSSLEDRIQKRTLSMIDNGMIDEVRYIVKNQLNIEHIDYIGFSEISSFLKGKITKDEVAEKIHIRTRQYAKRQMKWFDNQKFDYVFDMDIFSVNDVVDKLVEIK